MRGGSEGVRGGRWLDDGRQVSMCGKAGEGVRGSRWWGDGRQVRV